PWQGGTKGGLAEGEGSVVIRQQHLCQGEGRNADPIHSPTPPLPHSPTPPLGHSTLRQRLADWGLDGHQVDAAFRTGDPSRLQAYLDRVEGLFLSGKVKNPGGLLWKMIHTGGDVPADRSEAALERMRERLKQVDAHTVRSPRKEGPHSLGPTSTVPRLEPTGPPSYGCPAEVRARMKCRLRRDGRETQGGGVEGWKDGGETREGENRGAEERENGGAEEGESG
ncbi:MAG: hypothetical protein M3Y56_13875, partial [Armatimonadota bacterium]|nr:hypothetical protein [Armatimonadota bacterium]